MPPVYCFYNAAGDIMQVLQGSGVNPEEVEEATGLQYVQVSVMRYDYCTNYHVVNGEVVPK